MISVLARCGSPIQLGKARRGSQRARGEDCQSCRFWVVSCHMDNPLHVSNFNLFPDILNATMVNSRLGVCMGSSSESEVWIPLFHSKEVVAQSARTLNPQPEAATAIVRVVKKLWGLAGVGSWILEHHSKPSELSGFFGGYNTGIT